MLKKLLFLFSFIIALPVSSENRSDSEMLSIARERLSASVMTRSIGVREPELIEKTDFFTIYGYPEESFVIISRNSAYMPVLAISNTPYKSGQMPDGFKWWLKTITQSMEAGIVSKTRAIVTPVDNFVKTKWGQGEPYNGMCPKIGTSRPPAGCVATAMAQIMNYYQYPEHGMGTGSYTNGGKPKTVAIKNQYRWDRMLNTYTPQSSALSKTAVQYLLSDAGASVNMEYSMYGSGAYHYDAAIAFYQNFQYDSLAVRQRFRTFYDNQEWMDMIYNELSNQRPILYAGTDENSGGHAFVFSGIDAEGRVYVNWGWDGDADGFYDVADLTVTPKATTYHFDLAQGMVFGLYPHVAPAESEDFVSHWVTTDAFYIWTKEENLVEFALKDFWNLHIIPFEGTLDLYFENISGGQSDSLLIYDTAEDGFIDFDRGFVRNDNNLMRDTIDISDLQAGSYNVYIRSKDVREKKCRPARTYGGVCHVELTKFEDGTIVSSSDTVPDPDAIRTIRNPEFSIHKGNDAVYDLSGRQVYSSPKGIYIKNGKKVIR